MDLDLELELAEIQHRAMRRSKLIFIRCLDCGASPIIDEKDVYGYPLVVSHKHERGCVEYRAD